MSDYVTTNLRLPSEEYLRIKSLAAEAGMSVNDLVRSTFDGVSVVSGLVIGWFRPKAAKKKRKYDSIWDIQKLSKLPNKPMGLSAEDEIIYGD